MKLSMPSLTMEEHHEAFYYWGLAIEKGWILPRGNVLFHVDHHDDFVSGAYFRDFTRPFESLEERRAFTYSALGIADFIVPALYEGIFSQFFNMKGLIRAPFSAEEKIVRRMGTNTLTVSPYVPFFHAEKRRNGADGYRFFTYREGALSDTGELENVVLDIDLDYFAWDDSLSTPPPKRLEITKEAYEAFLGDPYHPFRILPQALLCAEALDGRFYLRYREAPTDEKPASEERIRTRAENFFTWLAGQSWKPSLVTLCRSVRSGYLPGDRAELVEGLVREGLQRLWGGG